MPPVLVGKAWSYCYLVVVAARLSTHATLGKSTHDSTTYWLDPASVGPDQGRVWLGRSRSNLSHT